MKLKTKIPLYVSTFLLLVLTDQGTKIIARSVLKDHPAVSLFYHSIVFKYAENTGAFLSLGHNLSDFTGNVLFIFLPIAFIAGLLVFLVRKWKSMSVASAMGVVFVLAGGTGNLIDRILFDRHVTDFVILGIGSLRTGVLNFADICVTTGALLLLFFYKTQHSSEMKESDKPSSL